MRRWLARVRRGYRGSVGAARVAPIHTRHLADQLGGQWIALRNGEVIEAGTTFDAVMLSLHRQDITNVTVMRVPAEKEAELVGLG